MGKGGVALSAAKAAVALGGIAYLLRSKLSSQVSESADQDDFALFTHSNNELHCMDRELRHPCVAELRRYVDDQSNPEKKAEALECARSVLEASVDFWELKNMTHLLLDLDTVDHVFDKESRYNDFVMLGVEYAKKLMAHDDCMKDFDEKSELECRCVPLYAKISIFKLKNGGKIEDARAIYDNVKSISWDGQKRTYAAGEAVAWDHFQHTPQIWVPHLRSQIIWTRDTWDQLPICTQFEENYPIIKQEISRALLSEPDTLFDDAYRFLYDKGSWDKVMLYHGREFTPECESVFPETCKLLKQWFPSKPGLPWTSDQNEQVMVIKMSAGTDVETHGGPANNILNIHMGVSGLNGAKLIVANGTYEWEEGKVIAWDGSYDHRVHCLECTEDRVIIMARYMHPDMSKEHYRGSQRTHFEDVPLELQ